MIRTLQDHGIHQGMSVYMECTIITPAQGRRPHRRSLGLLPRTGPIRHLQGQGRGAGHRRHRQGLQDHQQQLGIHRRRPHPRLRRRRRADRHGVHPVPSHRHGLAAERHAASWSPKASAAKAACLRNSNGERFMFGDIPDNYKPQTADNEEEGFLYVLGEKFQDKDSRRPPELLTRDHVARCIVREVKEGRGSPHGGVFLELDTFAQWMKKRESSFNAAEHWKKKAAEHVPPVQGTGQRRHHQDSRWRSARRRTTSWAACASKPTRRCRSIPGLFACGECAAGINGANRLGGNSLSDLLVLGKRAGEFAAKFAKDNSAGPGRRRPGGGRGPLGPELHRRAGRRREPVQGAAGPAGDDAGSGRHRPQGGRNAEGAGRTGQAVGPSSPRCGRRINREYNPGWHTCMDLHNLHDRLRGRDAGGHRTQGKPRRPVPRRLSQEGQRQVRQGEHRRLRGAPMARCRFGWNRSRRCRRN